MREYTFTAKLRGREFLFTSGSGVFSAKGVDTGTWLLVEKATVENGWKVLDLGCGIGIVGIVIKKVFPQCTVVMSDVNERALALAEKNAKELHAEVIVEKSDGFEKISGEFDTVLLNPPQTAGKETCFRLILESKDHLKKNGLLQVVARHQKGGRSLSAYMEECFGNVEQRAKGAGYRIYVSKKT